MSQFKQILKQLKKDKEVEKQTELNPIIQIETMFHNVEQSILNLGKRILDEFDAPLFQSELAKSKSFDIDTKKLIADLRVDIEIKPAKVILEDSKYAIFFPDI